MRNWIRLSYLLMTAIFLISGAVYFLARNFLWSKDLSVFSLGNSMAGFGLATTTLPRIIKRVVDAGVEIRIATPPGHMFTRILTVFISKRLFYKHFGQTIADNRADVIKALATGDIEEANKIERELNIDLGRQIMELILGIPASIVGKVWRFAKGEKKGDE